MAEEKDTSQEKTEEPTQKRLQDAKKEGQVPRSKELTTMAILLIASVSLVLSAGFLARHLIVIMRLNLDVEREKIFDTATMLQFLGASLNDAIISIFPLILSLMLAGILAPILLGGWVFSGKLIQPKLNRISPLAGLKRMFSAKSLVELLKAIAKVVVVACFAIGVLLWEQNQILHLGRASVDNAIISSLWLIGWAAIVLSISLLLITAIDVPFQIWDTRQKLKMTKQELRDEFKDTEGKPEVKSRIRQLQREMAERRMMSEVPKADVVITNPEHYSVAIKYNPDKADAPYVIAKGVDFIALKIREIAVASNVTILEAPPLSRAIYHSTELNQQIPSGLYIAVAQILAYVYQLKQQRYGKKPRPPKDYPIPEEFRHDN
ncbi:flagellar biosynthesis protein FlhB [Zooshikella harenae]|uniref:Flagellar biosynthetic protein FlhB n=1 Tax=Zooshikella harenae TaxID=2827238 RepID=A0ABS5Z8Q8_9GAMM|nr:flagellar biosynthesis protein FlhB [Zooshikella harenae]MBU2710438.1 flagellar biosynthesis protein FlhB [Zooshikella harenae]